MFFSSSNQPLDASFNEAEFENIFLHNRYPLDKSKQGSAAGFTEKAEIWALYDAEPQYNGLNLLRRLRALRGIHSDLKIGARSATNPAVRGFCFDGNTPKEAHSVWFEGYKGNISDATRATITMAPYSHEEKSRALSQKSFIRLIVPLRKKTPLAKIDALMTTYAIAALIDPQRFAGLVDADLFLFVPPDAVRAGVANYHRGDRMFNTHLLYGFNYFEQNGPVSYFSHGLNRFGMPDFLVTGSGSAVQLTTEHYKEVLKELHGRFLAYLTRSAKQALVHTRPLKAAKTLPEQVAAMMGKKVVLLPVGGRKSSMT